jgi:hypothetical protein
MTPRLTVSGLLVAAWSAVLVCSCGSPSTGSKDKSSAFDSAKLVRYTGNTAISMTHEVHDFEAYVKAYRSLSDPDSRISIFASPDDPNLITVFELTTSHEEARSAIQTQAFKASLQAQNRVLPSLTLSCELPRQRRRNTASVYPTR